MNKNCLFILLILFFIVSCSKKHKVINHQTNDFENKLIQNKINGVSYVGMPYSIDSSHFLSIKKINATWITTMPFGFIKDGNSTVNYNVSWQWIGEKKEGIINTIKLAHENGIKVMIKPHIWITGSWPGDLEFSNETDWLNFEKTYSDYIFSYAKLADSMRAESFCVGVELKKVTELRPKYFSQLIDSVKAAASLTCISESILVLISLFPTK